MDSIIVFDMDGVLTEVSESYREAIVQTVLHFTGQQITRDLIQEYKNQCGWNNDWALSQKIAMDLGVNVEYGDVVSAFNERFLGQNGDGLIEISLWRHAITNACAADLARPRCSTPWPLRRRAQDLRRRTLDAIAQIRLFGKLKLTNCARPGNRAGLFRARKS